MKVINVNARTKDTATINKIQAYMDKKESATFDDLKIAVSEVALMEDGEIHQLAIDAGYIVAL